MKIGILSDIHLEFKPYDFVPKDDVYYIVAGDIHPDSHVRFEWLDSHNIDFWIKGNHDYYGHSFPSFPGDAKIHSGINIEFGEVREDGEDLSVAGCTLWTNLVNPLDWYYYVTGLVDSRQIEGMNSDNYNELHAKYKEFLINSEADIIVTHHSPTYLSMHSKFMGNPYNCAFYSNLENMILHKMKKKPKVWIHGHTHEPSDYMLGDTRIICHPRGYPGESNFKGYQPKIIEV